LIERSRRRIAKAKLAAHLAGDTTLKFAARNGKPATA